MENYASVGNAIRMLAKQIALDYLKNQPGENEKSASAADIFHNCGFSWGDCENAADSQQQYWVVGLLRSLEEDGKIRRDSATKKWYLA